MLVITLRTRTKDHSNLFPGEEFVGIAVGSLRFRLI